MPNPIHRDEPPAVTPMWGMSTTTSRPMATRPAAGRGSCATAVVHAGRQEQGTGPDAHVQRLADEDGPGGAVEAERDDRRGRPHHDQAEDAQDADDQGDEHRTCCPRSGGRTSGRGPGRRRWTGVTVAGVGADGERRGPVGCRRARMAVPEAARSAMVLPRSEPGGRPTDPWLPAGVHPKASSTGRPGGGGRLGRRIADRRCASRQLGHREEVAVEDAEAEGGEQPGQDPEPDDHRGLRPAQQLEVVVERAPSGTPAGGRPGS